MANESLSLNLEANTTTDWLFSENMCIFSGISSFSDVFNLVQNRNCYRYNIGFSMFLTLSYLCILLFGLFGNCIVFYAVGWETNNKSASSIFILNLAFADVLVILCCIPANMLAHLFIPWTLGHGMCKIVVYSQGVSVFCSVYSLVAISYDRYQVIHRSLSITPNMSIRQTIPTILLIWLVGVLITLPWIFVFQVKYIDPTIEDETSNNQTLFHPKLPFCLELWDTKEQEIAYFFLTNVFICFLLPLGLIIVWSTAIWKNVWETQYSTSCTINTLSQCTGTDLERSISRDIQRRRKLRLLRLFTGLTFTFFIFWLPLYLIMARVKLSYTETFHGSSVEQQIVSVFIPLARLLANFNTCVNPVLYALLNQTFKQNWEFCPCFTKFIRTRKSNRRRREVHSMALNIAENLGSIRDSRV